MFSPLGAGEFNDSPALLFAGCKAGPCNAQGGRCGSLSARACWLWHVPRSINTMQAERRDEGLIRSVIVVCLLVLALAMIALSVSVTAQGDIARLPQAVKDAFASRAGNI